MIKLFSASADINTMNEKNIQLASKKAGYWDCTPLGEFRYLPRTLFEAGTEVNTWSVDLKTGIATRKDPASN